MLSDGKLKKNGQELTIKLVAYAQRPGLLVMQPVIAKALTDLGITVQSIATSGDSWDELDKIMADVARIAAFDRQQKYAADTFLYF